MSTISCADRRAKRYDPAAPQPPPVKAQEREGAQDSSSNPLEKPDAVPVCGVKMVGGNESTIEDVVESILIQAQLKKYMAEDSGEEKGTKSKGIPILNGLQERMCGHTPSSQEERQDDAEQAPLPHPLNSCGARIRGLAPLRKEGKKNIFSKLLSLQGISTELKGLIRRFEPTGGKLYLANKDLAMSRGWLLRHAVMSGRAVRCLRQVEGEEYPAMRAINFEVDDVLEEPILGYVSSHFGATHETAEARREQVKRVLDYIHEGIQHGDSVLVHCRMGTNRSAVVAAAYMMIYHGVSAEESLDLLQKRGPAEQVVRQPGFAEQLLKLEQELLICRRSVVVNSYKDLPNEWGNVHFMDTVDPAELVPGSEFLLEKLKGFGKEVQPGNPSEVTNPSLSAQELEQAEILEATAAHNVTSFAQDVKQETYEATPHQKEARTSENILSGDSQKDGVPDCVSACVEILEGQIWHNKMLTLERQGKNYVLCLAAPHQGDADDIAYELELCLPLDDATFCPLEDKEFLVRIQYRTFKIMAETDWERDQFVSVGREMVAKMDGNVEDEVDLADIDETGVKGGVAWKAQLICTDSDSDEEVWI